jgi:hypothetical protein
MDRLGLSLQRNRDRILISIFNTVEIIGFGCQVSGVSVAVSGIRSKV